MFNLSFIEKGSLIRITTNLLAMRRFDSSCCVYTNIDEIFLLLEDFHQCKNHDIFDFDFNGNPTKQEDYVKMKVWCKNNVYYIYPNELKDNNSVFEKIL